MGTRPWEEYTPIIEGTEPKSAPNYPAVVISWNDIQESIGILNEAEGDSVYRLPTEAEWEYACRAGTETRWSFGGDEGQLGQYAWYHDNASEVGEEYAHEVGQKLPNPWGLYDIHGNAAEWVLDWYDSYTSDFQVDPSGPVSGTQRVMRSSHYDSSPYRTRSATRSRVAPSYQDARIGVRLLRMGPAPDATTVSPSTWGEIKAELR